MSKIAADGLYDCVSFLLVRDGQMLLERRADDKELDPGKVAIPGGHMENGESELQALARELEEELSVTAKDSRWFCALLYRVGSETQRLHYYLIEEWDGDIMALEAAEVFWHPMDDPSVLDIEIDRQALRELERVRAILSVR